MCGTSLLLAPCSITRTLELGECSAIRDAIMQPAVPPIMRYQYKTSILETGEDIPPAMMISTSSMPSANLFWRPMISIHKSYAYV